MKYLYKLITLLMVLALQACVTIRPTDNTQFESLSIKAGHQSEQAIAIKWVVAESYPDLWAVCKQAGTLGCAYYGITKASCLTHSKDNTICEQYLDQLEYCLIITASETSYKVLGHELRHCFHRDYHKHPEPDFKE